MALSQSPHLTNIPEAIRIAASVDSAVDPSLKQQAFDYLTKVKDLCEETWQDCLALYMQGAGAGPSGAGRDGKEKLETSLRMFCEQVVDAALITKPQTISAGAFEATYKALVEFVQTEYVEGSCESGQSFLRNKLAFTLAHLFLQTYPTVVPTFFHPFLALLIPPDQSTSATASAFHPPNLVLHLFIEIAQEVHDVLLKSARPNSAQRNLRDGQIREAIRASGDERVVVDGLLGLVQKGLGRLDDRQWMETTELALAALELWTPWVDLSVVLTPQTLDFYRQLLQHAQPAIATPAAHILRSFAIKGMPSPDEKLQVLKVLDVVPLIDPLEARTRDLGDDHVAFRVALGAVVEVYGSQLLALEENWPNESGKAEAEAMTTALMPLMLRFLSDRHPEVPVSVSAFVSSLIRSYKKYSKPTVPPSKAGSMAPPPTPTPLPLVKQQLLRSLLDVVVRQLAWPDDAEWEPLADDASPDDEVASFYNMRQSFRSIIENISTIDKPLHTEVVANIVVSLLEALRSRGPSALSWQQAELAAHLVFTFGEINKANTRAAFYEIPPEVTARLAAAKRGAAQARGNGAAAGAADTSMSSGQSTPTSAIDDPIGNGVDAGAVAERLDYTQFPLTPLGQVLTLCMQSGLDSYPHPSVPLAYFESVVRYAEFWKSKPGAIEPVFQSMLDGRGVHHADEYVRRRSFYLFARLIRESRGGDLDAGIVPAILESLQDMLAIRPVLPPRETADMTDDDLLLKATTGKSYFQDQLHLFEAAGALVHMMRRDAARQLPLLGAVASPLMAAIGAGIEQYRTAVAAAAGGRTDLVNVTILTVHHHLLALGHFAKGFTSTTSGRDNVIDAPFKQMTEALLQALEVMKTERVVRDSARFAFSQFVSAVGPAVAELVPRFVSAVVTEFQTTELADFLQFLGLLMHKLKTNAFETMDMLLLPLLGRIFAVLREPVNGTDDALQHRRLQEAYLSFFSALMNANLEGVFITERNQPEFENVLSALLALAANPADPGSQRLAFAFFARSVIAWGTSAAAAAAPSVFADSARSSYSAKVASGQAPATNQHAVPRDERAERAVPGYETFIYTRLVPACFEVPADPKFNLKSGQVVLYEIAMLLRNTLQARGQEAIDFLTGDLLPRLQCPPDMAAKLIESLRTLQAKDFRKTFAEFAKAMKG